MAITQEVQPINLPWVQSRICNLPALTYQKWTNTFDECLVRWLKWINWGTPTGAQPCSGSKGNKQCSVSHVVMLCHINSGFVVISQIKKWASFTQLLSILRNKNYQQKRLSSCIMGSVGSSIFGTWAVGTKRWDLFVSFSPPTFRSAILNCWSRLYLKPYYKN